MGEVARLDRPTLGTLAERINAEHRACGKAAVDALEHAINAGDLLVQAKAKCPHGTWLAWLNDNFEGSVRTAQVYMRLTIQRVPVLLAAKAQPSAHLSIAKALDVLTDPPDTTPLPDVTRDAGRVYVQAATHAKKGDPAKPRDVFVSDEEWRDHYAVAVEQRVWEAGKKLRPVVEELYEFLDPRNGYRPEEAGKALAQMIGGNQALAANRITMLRNCVEWLERVVEVVEAERQEG